MKKKLIFMIVGIAFVGMLGNILKAEQPDCSICFTSPPWGGTGWQQFTGGDCYGPTYEFCGTVVSCMTGGGPCDPWVCHTEIEGCTVTFPY